MTTAILVAGLVLLIGLLVVVIRLPAWRLPAILVGLLALPGNVDDLGPQFRLDPNDVPNPLGPAVPATDVLIVIAALAALREGRRPRGRDRLLVGLAMLVAVIMAVSAGAALAGGVDGWAVVRGTLAGLRIPLLLYLALGHRAELGDGRRLLLAAVAGSFVLFGNGLYTTIGGDLERFTATTFGRNGFAVALAVCAILAAGLAYATWRRPEARTWGRASAAVAVLLVAGLVSTGTRMGLVVLIGAIAIGLASGPFHRDRAALRGLATSAAGLVLAVILALAWSTAGQRTLSILSDTGDTIGEAVTGITDPDELPVYSPIRSRSFFWRLAIEMTAERPLTGVGPYQWNHLRYGLDPESPKLVADPHQAYLQVAAEYGLPALAAYLVLLVAAAAVILGGLVRRPWRRLPWPTIAVVAAAAAVPLADLTNSHLFHVRMGAIAWLLIGSAIALAAPAPEPPDAAASGSR